MLYVLRAVLPLALVIALAAPSVRAQSAAAGAAIVGGVVDPMHAAVAGATVTATALDTGLTWKATSDPAGRFRLLALPVGTFRLLVEAPGFAAARRDVTLALGQAVDVTIQMPLASLAENVTVSMSTPVVDVLRTQTSALVSPAEVQTLPLNGRNYLDLALLTPGVSRTNTGASQRFAETSAVPGTGISIASQRNLNNTFIVDGLSANDDAASLAGTFFSQEVIREFQVISSGAAAEFGRASSGVINIVTQSGANERRGAAYAYFRDDALDARNALATTDEPLAQQQFGATFGGPIRRDRDFLFVNAEAARNRRTGLVTIDRRAASVIDDTMERLTSRRPVATGAFATGFDTLNLFARADRQWAPSVHGVMRYTAYDVHGPNARTVGALNAPTRGAGLDNLDQTVAFTMSSVGGASALHELRAQATRSRLDAPVNDPIGPAVNIAGVASFGTSTASPTARALDMYQAVDAVSWQRGAQLIKGGADVLLNRVDIVFPGALQGVYTFSSLQTFLEGRYATYQQAFGTPSQFQSNWNLALFAQDEWRARQDLTVNAGLRYDAQWLPPPIALDGNNVSPRAGIAWSPGSHRTIVRANGGVFFDRLPLRATSNALQRDGVKYRVAVLPSGAPGAPVFPSVLPQFPDGLLVSVTTIDPFIQSASSRQAALSIEHALDRSMSIEAVYQHVAGRGLVMSRNVNAPTLSAGEAARLGVANLGRPDPSFANVTRVESIGRAAYDGLMVAVQARHARWEARVGYSLSRAFDDAGNFFFSQPQDAGDVRGDWGPSDNDQRHRLTVSGALASPWRQNVVLREWRVSGIFSYGSALPFNPLTGTDRNNDTNVNDRPVGFPRNSFRGFDSATLDLRVARAVAIGAARLLVSVDGFNVLNRTNLALPNAIYGVGTAPLASFGHATAAGDPRQLQIGARISW